MYKAMESFLRRPTWYSRHELDLAEFNASLATIVRNPGFNADLMGEFMDQTREGTLSDKAYDDARSRYVHDAWAVRRYLKATGQI